MAVNVKSYKRRSSKGKVYTVRAYSRGGNKKVNLDGMEINRKAPTMSDEEFDRLQAKQDQEMREFIQNLQGVAKAYGVKGGTEKLIQPRSKNPIAKAKADTKSETARIMKEIRPTLSGKPPVDTPRKGGFFGKLKAMWNEELAKAAKKYDTYDEFFGTGIPKGNAKQKRKK